MNETPGPAAQELLIPGLRRLRLHDQTPPPSRIAVGVDGSAGSAAALRWAAAEACHRHAALWIISAWQEPDLGRPQSPDPAQAASARVQKALARIMRQQRLPRHISCVTAQGDPGTVLLHEADGADLLVLGTTRTGTGPVPGRTGLYCLQHAHSPLVFISA